MQKITTKKALEILVAWLRAGPTPGDLLRIEHRLVRIAGLQEEENA